MNFSKIITLSIFAGVLMFATSCSQKKDDTSQQKETKHEVFAVKTKVVQTDTITRTIEYAASLIPFKEVYLAPATPGKIDKIYVEIGDRVSEGDVIAVMDSTNLAQARLNLLNLETNYKRLDTLKKTNTISDKQYDEIKTGYEAAKVNYEFLKKNTFLKAPFGGIISGKYFEDKENFAGAPNTPAGKSAIVKIVELKKLKAVFGISSVYYPLIKEGMKTEITSDTYPGEQFSGAIYKVYPTIDPATKTFTVEVKVNNGNLKLRPGMFARIRLTLGNGEAILIPTVSIIKQTGTNDKYVFLNENGTAKRVQIKTGRAFDDKTEITEGLKAGDELIVAGQNKLMDKSLISVK